jgi:rhodanese-related sulfurtransferase
MNVEEQLASARTGLRRLDPHQAHDAAQAGAILVDTRPAAQRDTDGAIPGALVIERNDLEWRTDPTTGWRIPQAIDHDVTWIVFCNGGDSSSLAAASLQSLGLHNATDLIGGFQAWKKAGLPVVRTEAVDE